MIEFIFIIGSFALGWIAREAYAHYLINKLTKKLSNMMTENFEKSIIDITIEKHEDTFFAYQKDNGIFLAQGKDIYELSDILTEKYPGKFFNTNSETMKMLAKE